MKGPEVRHRLAAILAADAAGYSRLMATDDRATLAVLDAARSVFRGQVESNGGRVVDTAGDSVLAVFATAGGAVNAALATQETLAGEARSLPGAGRLLFRIGIHLGDVLEKADGSVYGDGVNIAARLQALCESGRVVVSHTVHGAVPARIQALFEDIGEQVMKNIAAPVRAFALGAGRQAESLDGSVLRFGRAHVWPQQRRLRIDGEDAPLGGRAFDLLVALIERRDRVVSRNELYEVVWPGRVIENNNLAVQMLALRKLLGANAIATVPGRGYRFTLTASDEAVASARMPAADPSIPEAAAGPEPFSLPVAQLSLFGRDDDLAALEHLLANHRHVTVLGAGGIGKTSLALAAAHTRRSAQRDGAAWVDLSSLSQPALVIAAVAQALNLPVSRGEHPIPALIAGLKSLDVLLVLDNAEHLVDAVARLVDAITANAAKVRVLVTSQVALKIEHERVFRLGSLSVPDTATSAHKAMSHGAIALFVDQAQAADRRFELSDDNVGTVIALCRHLDGLALAIKLAAGRLGFFGLQGLEQRLAERLKLLAGGSRSAPTRQQTLRAALDWSYGLLSVEEQATFRRLGVFAGGFTLQLASAVAGDDASDEWAVIEHLSTLVDHSLVTADRADPPRYRLLESTREYALACLTEKGELQATQRRHAQTMFALLEQPEQEWRRSDEQALETRACELDNVRAALDWTREHDTLHAVDLAVESNQLFTALGLTHEYSRRLAALEPALDRAADSSLARYWLSRSFAEFRSHEARGYFAAKAAAHYRALGDEVGLYLALCQTGLSMTCSVDEWEGVRSEVMRLEQPDWPARWRVNRLYAETLMHLKEERYVEARTTGVACLDLCHAVGAKAMAAFMSGDLIVAELALGHIDEAFRIGRTLVVEESARPAGILDWAWGSYARCLAARGNSEQLREALVNWFEQCRRREWERFGHFTGICTLLAMSEQRHEAAARLVGYVVEARRRLGLDRLRAFVRHITGMIAALEAFLDAPTLQRLLAEGATLDEEAVCALTLERAGGDRASGAPSMVQSPPSSDRA